MLLEEELKMEECASGRNTLFSDPDCETARAFFRTKSRAMLSKITTVRNAVSSLINDGDYLTIGGFGTNRIPTAVIHEMMRQGKKKLGFAGHTATHDFQLLCAGGCIDRCDVAYIIGLEARGLSPAACRYVEGGNLQLTEWTNASLSWRIKAAAMGISFIPARNMLGTDTFKCSAAKTVKCPYTGRKYVAHPALYPDVALIHVHEADIYGNCRVYGASVSDQDLAKASKKVIITAERLIHTNEIRMHPERTFIPYWCVDAVIEVPYGSYPGNMPYLYFSDEDYLQNWLKLEKDPAAFDKFVNQQIYDTRDFIEYLELNGGIDKMQKLRTVEQFIDTHVKAEYGGL